MQNTLAQLKRDIEVGKRLQCIEIKEAPVLPDGERGELTPVPLNEKMQAIRTVNKKDTTGFYLDGSFCGFPKASNLHYEGDTFTITEYTGRGLLDQTRTYKFIK